MKEVTVTDSVLYVGCDDRDIDLFESQYHVPNGVTYNSYVIMDQKIAVMDTVDQLIELLAADHVALDKSVISSKTPPDGRTSS